MSCALRAVGPSGYGVVAPECNGAGGGSGTGGGTGSGTTSELAAAWNFDEGSGTAARDASGHGNVAVLLGTSEAGGLLRPRFLVTLDGVRHDAVSSATISQGWHFLAGTYDGAALKIYVDGVERGEVAAKGSLPGYHTPLRLGANGGGGEFFKGLMDNVRIYPRGLTAAEVTKDMPLRVTEN